MASTDELLAAIENGSAVRARSILVADPSAATARDPQGVSALMRARYRGDASIAQAILAVHPGLDVFEAASFGELDRLTGLVTDDPSLVMACSGDGFTPLHLAAFFGKADAARLLLVRGADVDAVGTGWMTGTALHSAASGRHRDVVEILLEAGANPDARQSGGWTALHAAAQHGDGTMVDLLLRHGAQRDPRTDDGVDAAELARREGHGAVADRLAQDEP